MRSIYKILLLAFIFRLLIAPFGNHGDVYEYLNWGKNLEEFGTLDFYFRDIPDAGHPNYPPGFYYILLSNQKLYEVSKGIFWKANVYIKPFPSIFFVWFASDRGRIFFNKLPAIIADIGIGYLIYLFVQGLKKGKSALISSSVFLFSPPIWYNSAYWGQTESLFALPLIASFYAVYKKRLILAPLLYMVALLIKPSSLLILPIFAVWWLRKIRFAVFIKTLFSGLILFYLVHIPFHPSNTFAWIIKLYRDDIKEVLGQLVANAFNFWGLIFGFEAKGDGTLFLGIPASIWGLAIFGLSAVYLFSRLRKKESPQDFLLAAALLAFGGFLFLTRVHERYFYPVLLFLAPLIGFDKRIKRAFFVLSGIHLINLYHFWWVPRVNFLVTFFSNRLVESVLIIANMVIFIWLLAIFRREYAKT